MSNKRRVPHGLAFILFFASQSFLLSMARDCAPYPVSLNLKNVTLGNTTARGVSLSVGSPEQPFAFLPQWPLNSTFVYGTDGHCGESWSEAACQTFRGGAYNLSASTTYEDSPSNAIEASPYPAFVWGKDNLTLNSNTTLAEFPIGIARADWGAQGYHPQVAFGLGKNSTILNTLYAAGHIASRSWSMFWGRTGGTLDKQQDGTFVFGGFDQSKTSGENYTSDLNYSNSDCPTGMIVTISDLALNFANGTSASLFDGMRSSAISACIVPDYPVLMTLPREPYFERFEQFTGHTLSQRSFGIYYYGMLYPDSSALYTGDLTIKLNSGFSVRVPNDQLVVPNLNIDQATGSLIANGSAPELVLNAIQQVNQGDLPQLGRQFLSSAYLMLNQDSGTFTLWEAALDTNEDLVAIDGNNRPVDRYCTATNELTTSPSPPPSAHDDIDKMSNGEIAGIVVGSVAGVAIIAAVVFLVLAKKRKLQNNSRTGPVIDSGAYYPETAYTSRDPPSELGPSGMEPYVPHELPTKQSPPRRFTEVPELP